jgi:NTP pyrophosphatase (non-canonical NTP hydrolase)
MKITPLNPPTEREREALTILQEECAEVIKEVSKILRFGWDSYHPADPSTTNRSLLTEEVGQLKLMIEYLTGHNFLNEQDVWAAAMRKITKLEKYSSLYDR